MTRGTEHVSAGIITTAALLIIGYLAVTRIVGLAFRFVVPVVLIAILVAAGLFSAGISDRAPGGSIADPYRPYGRDGAYDGGLGDVRLGEIPEIVVDAVRSALRGTLALLDGARDTEPAGPSSRYPEPRRFQHDRFGEDPPAVDRDGMWESSPRSGRAY